MNGEGPPAPPGAARAFTTVFFRELFEWRWFLLAAPCLGLMVRLSPLLPGVAHHEKGAILQATLIALAVLLALGGLVVIGASLVARDLAERRLSFYLTRPVPTGPFWFAKLAAAAATVGLMLVGLLLPTLLAGDSDLLLPSGYEPFSAAWIPLTALEEATAFRSALDDTPRASTSARLAISAVLALLILVSSHVVSILARSRGPWMLLDFVGLGTVGAALWSARAELLASQAFGPLALAERGFLVGALLVLLVAGWRQIELGRTDLERGRRVLSIVTWLGLLVVAVAVNGYASWAVRPSIDDLVDLRAGLLSPDGRHLLGGGRLANRAGASGAFVIDLEPGDPSPDTSLPDASRGALHLPGLAPVAAPPIYSRQDQRLVWSECRRLLPFDCELRWLDPLSRGAEPRGSRSPIRVDRYFAPMALSPDGSRVALARYRALTVYDLESGNLLVSTRARFVYDVRFIDSTTVRGYVDTAGGGELIGNPILILEIDLPTRTVAEVGRIEQPHGAAPAAWSPDGSRMLLQTLTPRSSRIFDARTGERLFDIGQNLGLDPASAVISSRFLADGRLVVTESTSRTPTSPLTEADIHEAERIWVLDTAGEVEQRLELDGRYGHLRARHEIAAGHLLFQGLGSATGVEPLFRNEPDGREHGAGKEPRARRERSTYWFDVERGDLRLLARGLEPLAVQREVPEPGSPPTRLFLTADRSIVRWEVDLDDPAASPAPRVLFGPTRLDPDTDPILRVY